MTKRLPWFRFYTEWIDNIKVLRLSRPVRLVHVELMCLRGRGELDLEDLETMAKRIRIPVKFLAGAVEKLAAAGLITDDLDLHDWDKRQFSSDLSAERTRAYRSRKRHSDGQVAVTVTGSDTDTETETEIEPNGSCRAPRKRAAQPAPYNEIVDYLNNQAGTRFSPTSKATRQLIAARWKEGASLEDFKAVIDAKVRDWGADGQMRQYLRPATLFNASKFESYLNGLGGANARGKTWRDYAEEDA